MAKALLVTIPKSTSKDTLLREIRDINDNGLIDNHRLGRKPKQAVEQVLFVYNGAIRYVADVIGYELKAFVCETTGIKWDEAWYIEFENVRDVPCRITYKGFQGFRYVEELTDKNLPVWWTASILSGQKG